MHWTAILTVLGFRSYLNLKFLDIFLGLGTMASLPCYRRCRGRNNSCSVSHTVEPY